MCPFYLRWGGIDVHHYPSLSPQSINNQFYNINQSYEPAPIISTLKRSFLNRRWVRNRYFTFSSQPMLIYIENVYTILLKFMISKTKTLVFIICLFHLLLIHAQQMIQCRVNISTAGLEYRPYHFLIHIREHVFDVLHIFGSHLHTGGRCLRGRHLLWHGVGHWWIVYLWCYGISLRDDHYWGSRHWFT